MSTRRGQGVGIRGVAQNSEAVTAPRLKAQGREELLNPGRKVTGSSCSPEDRCPLWRNAGGPGGPAGAGWKPASSLRAEEPQGKPEDRRVWGLRRSPQSEGLGAPGVGGDQADVGCFGHFLTLRWDCSLEVCGLPPSLKGEPPNLPLRHKHMGVD